MKILVCVEIEASMADAHQKEIKNMLHQKDILKGIKELCEDEFDGWILDTVILSKAKVKSISEIL